MDRAAGAFVLAFAISLAAGAPMIRALKRLGAKQTVSEDAPSRHQAKQGTPTMGGLMILLGLTVTVAAYATLEPEPFRPLLALGLAISFGLIGFLDDYLIARRGKNLGLRAREKLCLQIVAAVLFVIVVRQQADADTAIVRFWEGDGKIDLGGLYYPVAALFVIALANAVNFADGLDGLAGGIAAIIGLGLIAATAGVPGQAWVASFAGGLAGACSGFLWYNAHPAQVFMGDTGSLALGAGLAGLAVLGKIEAPFQVCALVPWAVLASVVIQVTVFKYRRKRRGIEYAKAHRVFRRTPLHHHFEELGWPETRIVQRFWLATAASVAVGVWLLRSV